MLLLMSVSWLAVSYRQLRPNKRVFSWLLVTSLGKETAISVFDNVMSEEASKLLDITLTQQLDEYGSGHNLYYRNETPNSLLEHTLHLILQQLCDSSPIVEYWFRDEWLNLELHRDCDELLLQESGTLRYPERGNILYLFSGSQVCGPTLIFNDESSLPPLQAKLTDVTIIPAKASRVVTFDGSLAHAVVRPPLAYYDEAEGGSNLELFIRKGRPADMSEKRSVILFNTWKSPPLAIERGSVKSSDIKNIVNDKSEWRIAPTSEEVTTSSTRYVNFIVPLLGTKLRRGGIDTSMKFLINSSSRDSIMDQSTVSKFALVKP